MSRRADVKQSMVGKIANKRRKVISSNVDTRRRAARQAAAPTMTQAAVLYKQVRGAENKFFDPWTANGLKQLDCSNAASPSNSAGNWILFTAATPGAVVINQVPQGTTQSSRLGRRMLMKALRLKGFVQAAATGTISQVALSLVHQLPPNNPANMPPYADIWTAQSVNSLRNVDNDDKLKIVRRFDWGVCGNATTPQTGQELIPFDEYITFPKGIVTEWTFADTTGTYSNMEKGALMLYAQGNASATPPQIFLSARLYFDDF